MSKELTELYLKLVSVPLPKAVKQVIGLVLTFFIALLANVELKDALITLLISLFPVLGIDQINTRKGQEEFADLLKSLK